MSNVLATSAKTILLGLSAQGMNQRVFLVLQRRMKLAVLIFLVYVGLFLWPYCDFLGHDRKKQVSAAWIQCRNLIFKERF